MKRSHAFVLLLVAVWLVLYLPHLRTSPSWYGDETLTLMIGRSLFAGEGADRAMSATFWHPSYAYQPGYAWLVGLASSFTNGDILGGRFLNSCLALLIALGIFLGGRRIFGGGASTFGALVFLTYGQTVLHFRWIYPHNLVALGFAIVVLSLLRKSSWKSDWAAGTGLALAAAAHPLFAHGAIAAWLCRIKRPAAWVRMAALPALVLVACLGWTLARQSPHLWALEDIGSLGAFYQKFSQENGAGFQIFQNIRVFYTHDLFHLGTAAAALLCCNRRFYPIPLFLAVVSGLLLQNRQNLPVFYYQAIVFVPVMAMAWAGAARTLEIRLRQWRANRRWHLYFWTAACLIPFALFLQVISPSLTGTLVPRNHLWTTQNIAEVEAASKWLNERVTPGDLVICHQNIGWLLNSRTADLMQATAWSGRPTFTFEETPDKERFRYPAGLDDAKFVVLGDIDRRWTLAQPNVAWIVEEMSKLKWRVVWEGEHYMIVANPGFLLGSGQ